MVFFFFKIQNLKSSMAFTKFKTMFIYNSPKSLMCPLAVSCHSQLIHVLNKDHHKQLKTSSATRKIHNNPERS